MYVTMNVYHGEFSHNISYSAKKINHFTIYMYNNCATSLTIQHRKSYNCTLTMVVLRYYLRRITYNIKALILIWLAIL